MKRRFAYAGTLDPPAPVLPLRVAAPGSEAAVLLPAVVDTGADCTLIPRAISRRLDLPRVDRLLIEGVGGTARPAPVHAAWVEYAGRRVLARVVAFGEETILGRDLLNRVIVLLDGPGLRLSIR